MKLGVTFALSILLLASTAAVPAQAQSTPYTSTTSSSLQLTQKTEAPGVSLAPGSYTVRISDRLNDRIIVQVQKSGSKTVNSFLAYPNPGLRGGSYTGPITFLSGIKGRPALRGFGFAGGPVVEFVYPKADAVTLAKTNAVRVMAVDPASEGRVSLPNLTQADMTEVTLWMLTPTPVDPKTSQPGIQAARYQAPSSTTASNDTAQTPATTAATPASAPSSNYTAPAQASVSPSYRAPARPAPQPAVQVASNTHAPRLRPKVQELPHTASNLPGISMLGLFSLVLGGGLTIRRLQSDLKA